MDKNAIKKYAVWARRELIERVSQRALIYGISADAQADAGAVLVNGQALSQTEQKQRKALIEQIKEKGYEQVIEEVAYTWFNRFAAMRFMEVNGYLPSHIRVFTDDDGAFKPQILTEAIHLDLDGLNMEKIYALERENKKEELFKYLLIVQCNALSSILPGMFQKIEDYTELLLPDYLLREGSVIEKMVTMIPEEDWTDQVQIIGWLYQYYNTEPKDQVFADLKKNIKISKEKIPAATQLFTPDWIVHYMVENSLGRLWIEGVGFRGKGTGDRNGAFAERMGWKYYLPEAEQEPAVEAQLKEIRKVYAALKPEEILCIDPCMGSGHILCVLFDVLVRIYEDYGYTAREAAVSIVQNNLWGLDIDDRAAQLAYFAVMMKARQYDRRFFSRGIQPHVYAIAESNHVNKDAVEYFCNGDTKLEHAVQTIITELHDAKEYGSILTTTPQDWDALYTRFDEIRDDISIYKNAALALELLVQNAQTLGQKYWVTVTNPPYAGVSNLNSNVADYVKKNYPDSKSDLFAVFIERCGAFVSENGYQAMITQHAWMFLSSFEKLRAKLLTKDTVNMAHLGARAFEEIGGEVVQTTSFVLRNGNINGYQGTYCRLIDPTSQDGKEQLYLSSENRFIARQDNFSKIPGSPVAYWVSEKICNAFQSTNMATYGTAKVGIGSGNTEYFLKLWYELQFDDISFDADLLNIESVHFVPINKGGTFRRWYGNNEYVINWFNNGYELKNYKDDSGKSLSYPRNLDYQLKRSLTWGDITSGPISVRISEGGFFFSDVGNSLFLFDQDNELYVLGYTNTTLFKRLTDIINTTIHFKPGNMLSMPLIYVEDHEEVDNLVRNNISLSRTDWDSFETSWDFKIDPMIARRISGAAAWSNNPPQMRVEASYKAWQLSCGTRFQTLKSNEEELNRIFIDIYGLQDELTSDVADKDVTVRRFFDTKDDIPESMRGSSYALTKQDAVKSLISYAVGCMFGRYSLDEEGLVYAGGEWDASKYKIFPADKDAIIPICDDEYFTDDIVGLFVKFIETVYGAETLEENLHFIADALGTKGGTSREVIRNYFLNDFYKDHLKTYQKRPIYWLFDSGKKNGFRCLIYMHRYQPDTIARIRTDYVHEQQSRYRTAIADLEQRVNSASASERVKLNKQLQKLQGQSEEVRTYEEKIHHLADQFIAIDLDDGVKVNYAKFQDVLAKIK